jgi:hypothetical protein
MALLKIPEKRFMPFFQAQAGGLPIVPLTVEIMFQHGFKVFPPSRPFRFFPFVHQIFKAALYAFAPPFSEEGFTEQ